MSARRPRQGGPGAVLPLGAPRNQGGGLRCLCTPGKARQGEFGFTAAPQQLSEQQLRSRPMSVTDLNHSRQEARPCTH
ncbi:hypothetical protein NDU88_001445 [Pleurodeles waltl]|uniref:Uncharacterized protein n=1 Tax=Pleurodeles waltl TaxID=8319 RepID=A0AAV7S7M9_PLEWA|nr:hypothetical protein NDU88_001445 [Pleurodeles waltl]